MAAHYSRGACHGNRNLAPRGMNPGPEREAPKSGYKTLEAIGGSPASKMMA